MAPVPGRLSNAEKDGPIFTVRFFKRFWPPGIPIDRVICVLEQIRRRLMDQAIRHNLHSYPLIRVIGIWRGEVVDVRFLQRFALQKPHIFPFTTAKSNEPLIINIYD
jgi:hypothetical protein